jgi:hypothetical protein
MNALAASASFAGRSDRSTRSFHSFRILDPSTGSAQHELTVQAVKRFLGAE